ncbi:rhomboid family intramembrane serine protease [Fibrobacter sp. UWB2]|uniref:rhomboid family intramembrane serine protease n=1 Tax=Fibrobacter sp. UWB2 TaxID=1964358 RepID=UPI000B52595B|nr:rhomboid family intramembrane serine protease [Fibrobacter sp. UWB2]OWV23979.1 rhomboid family intramembrane serine protease [Fibrobacter sp. UWB2]
MKPFKYLPKALQTLLLANAAVFIIAFLGRGLEINLGAGYGSLTDYISYYGAFMPRVPLELWRYVTYMFIHFDFMHFFFNMLMLWMFGSEVAEWMGSRHFISMYFFCGIFAALFSFFMCLLGLTNNPIIGASGALMGVFVAYYKFFPDRVILMFFVIPMRIKNAMWVMIALDILFANSGDMIAHFAHLGGVVAGFLYMAVFQNGPKVLYNSPLSAIFRLFSSNPEKYNRGRSSRSSHSDSVEEPEVLEGEVFYVNEQKRMDEILKKVEREGLQSLSESERDFLLKAGDKLRRRRGGF